MMPDVLVIVLDTLRADRMSCYGHVRPTTPGIDRFADEATVFERAFSTSAWTPPAHASMFTGLWPSRHGVVANYHLPAGLPTIAEAMHERGYATLGVANLYPLSPDRGFDRGFERYASPFALPRIRLPLLGSRSYELTPEFVSYALRRALLGYDPSWRNVLKLERWLAAEKGPWFAFINIHAVHGPYRPPRGFAGRFTSAELLAAADPEVTARLTRGGGYAFMTGALQASAADWDVMRARYDEELLYADMLVVRLLDSLRRHGRYQDALIIITSDHGEHFGEHGLAYHGFGLDDGLLHVPLIVRWPGGRPARQRDDRLASLVDLPPTIAEITGATMPADLDGRSLWGTGEGHPEVFAEFHPSALSARARQALPGGAGLPAPGQRALQAVRTGRFKHVRGSDGSHELFDLALDPGEEHDIAAEQPDVVAELGALIDERLVPPDRWPREQVEDHDEHVASHLRNLGYL